MAKQRAAPATQGRRGVKRLRQSIGLTGRSAASASPIHVGAKRANIDALLSRASPKRKPSVTPNNHRRRPVASIAFGNKIIAAVANMQLIASLLTIPSTMIEDGKIPASASPAILARRSFRYHSSPAQINPSLATPHVTDNHVTFRNPAFTNPAATT